MSSKSVHKNTTTQPSKNDTSQEESIIDNDMKKHLEEWKKVAEERPLRIMVCGLGGVGKSALINHLLELEEGEQRAEEGMSGRSTTSFVRKFEKTTKRGVKVCLFDTPGFGDVDISDEKIIAMMEKKTERNLDVIFYCISLEGSCRVQKEDARAIKIITQTFSSEIWKKAVVVFTFANALEKKETISSPGNYWTVIQNIKEKMVEVLQKERVPKDIIDELPMLTAGYTDPILRYEAEECNSFGGWDNRLFLEALKQVEPAFVPAFVQLRWSWKDWARLLASGVAAAAGVGAIAGAVMCINKAKPILNIKYEKWRLNHKPVSPHQATLTHD